MPGSGTRESKTPLGIVLSSRRLPVVRWTPGIPTLSPRLPTMDPIAARRADIEAKQTALAPILEAMECEAILLLMPAHVAWFTSGMNVRGLIADSERPAIYTNGRQRWLICSNVDTQRLFDEELDRLGFQLKEWSWEGGRSDLLASVAAGPKDRGRSPVPEHSDGERSPSTATAGVVRVRTGCLPRTGQGCGTRGGGDRSQLRARADRGGDRRAGWAPPAAPGSRGRVPERVRRWSGREVPARGVRRRPGHPDLCDPGNRPAGWALRHLFAHGEFRSAAGRVPRRVTTSRSNWPACTER